MHFDTFYCFPKLPIEIRLKIWTHALPAARVVEIEWYKERKLWYEAQESKHEPCALLLINKESRDLYLLHYKNLFSQYDGHNELWPLCYFNTDADTLYIGQSWRTVNHVIYGLHIALASIPFPKKLRFLAFRWELWFDVHFPGENGARLLSTEEGSTRYIERAALSIPCLLSAIPKLKAFIITVSDVDSRAIVRPEIAKPIGEIEFVGLRRGSYQDGISSAGDAPCQKWVENLLKTHSGRLNPVISVKQVLRGGTR